MHIELALDVNDPARMIAFWSQVLGYAVEDEGRFDTPDRVYWSLVDPADRGRAWSSSVCRSRSRPRRVHIDVHVPDIEAAAEAAVGLGATRIDSEPVTEVGAAWIRLEDPEGNIFCFVRERRP